MKRILPLLLLCSLLFVGTAHAQLRWDITGHHEVSWNGQKGGLPHADHIEMSGRNVSVVYYWEVGEDGRFQVNRHLAFPSLRTIPNDTHATWQPKTDVDFLNGLKIDGGNLEKETVQRVALNGVMTVESVLSARNKQVSLTRQLWPSTTLSAICEVYTFSNKGEEDVTVALPAQRNSFVTPQADGVTGSYCLLAKTDSEWSKVTLKPGETVTFGSSIQGYAVKGEKEMSVSLVKELDLRRELVEYLTQQLDFKCPNDTLNTMFALAKIRGSESIFDTPEGPMHSPGGESYYAAMWCNDQAEYINPFFPFLGYDLGNQSALTTWQCYLKQINPEYHFVPWSIICGGKDAFGRMDRGDAAMLAYGAGRYCLEMSSKTITEQVWPLIEWCLEYSRRRLNAQGVVESEADELEHRLPCGQANLCTSSLYYDALLSASYLAKELGKPSAVYIKQAEELKKNINSYFGANVEGFDTYRYYDGNDRLRSWICIPLTMGIYDRAQNTINAMFSPQLWTDNGMLSVSGDVIFWDRSTLYGLRGAFAAGYPDLALDYMLRFSGKRLLGNHVPYVVEAWPEGGQRHLSAENGLYCRVITEGLFGFRPTGFRSFSLTPQMPAGWNEYSLCNVHACSSAPYNIQVKRVKGDKLSVTISYDDGKAGKLVKTVQAGKPVSFILK